jgi:hypothetical protein
MFVRLQHSKSHEIDKECSLPLYQKYKTRLGMVCLSEDRRIEVKIGSGAR